MRCRKVIRGMGCIGRQKERGFSIGSGRLRPGAFRCLASSTAGREGSTYARK